MTQEDPVAWKWRRRADHTWTFVDSWNAQDADDAKSMEDGGWEVVRLYDHAQPKYLPAGWQRAVRMPKIPGVAPYWEECETLEATDPFERWVGFIYRQIFIEDRDER